MAQPPSPTPPEPEARQRSRWVWVLALALVVAAGSALYVQPWQARVSDVVTERATLGPVLRVLAVNGRIAALHSVDVRAAVSGTLETLPVTEGASVRMGDVLAQINSDSQDAAVRQARAALDAGRVSQAQADADFARFSALKGIIAGNTIDAARSKAQTAAQDVRRLTALYDQALIQLERYIVLAPITGTIMSINGEPGQLVDPPMALVTLADLAELVVDVDVDETYATQVHTGQPAILQLAGMAEKVEGHVSFVAGRVDPASGGLAVKLAFDTPQTAPLGLTVTANIIVDRRDAALTVPRAALLADGDGHAVFIVEEGIALRRAIAIIDWPADRLIVTQGLEPDDVVVTDMTGMTDGQAVRVVQP